ncbi:formate dehydrogenase accessory protein FdhE [Halomonas sp. PAMB 3264]|uniref:formate dehydrogenase accessory protein FdhE n=1 Tax=Halomonas sp. PAMB 3264 TaxID=3075222 RepID=UPI00289BDC23|nr:formate dehydrogenase accessory protein FdhE [Halomonas sp. PAMB 3264]WNL41926.1 formate dehydrogenase accessory protein FdhE [Halomonas sp. PAMB 3264]
MSDISDTLHDPKPPRHGEPPQVVVAESRLFATRAARFRELQTRLDEMGLFLGFNDHLARAQHRVLKERQADAFDPQSWDMALAHEFPPLAPTALIETLDWQADLTMLLDALDRTLADEGETFDAQRALLATPGKLSERREIARAIVEQKSIAFDQRALAPLVGAALQVTWTRLARSLKRLPGRPKGAAQGLCPCCGSPPVASTVQLGRHRSRVRYLVCGLCATQWYLERARCSHCFDTEKLDYIGVEGPDGKRALPLRAESCGACRASVKLMDREWEADTDPFADDIATLGLDVLLEELGYARAGFNPLLAFGDAQS